MEGELRIDLSDVIADDDGLDSKSAMDELMSALDVLEGHADESIQANKDTETQWITILNERDELILSNKQSIEDLQSLNDKLREENGLLKHQLLQLDQNDIVSALQDDAGDSRKMSLQLQAELAELQIDVVSRLKAQNSTLQERLVRCGQSYSEVFARLRQEHMRQHPDISQICKDVQQSGKDSRSEREQERLRTQLEELCEIYNKIILGACEECEEYLESIDRIEHEHIQTSARERSLSVSPRKSRPGSSMETEKHYIELLQSSENSNRELRHEIEKLQKEMNSREQKHFNDAMARTENNKHEQIEKMKAQIAELSQELSLLNVDNRALRERILKTENDNVILSKQVKDTDSIDEELKALQSNLDSQLVQNHSLESKVKRLELIRLEHNTVCERAKMNLIAATEKASKYEDESRVLRQKLEASKGLQEKFDEMNGRLHNQMEHLQSENRILADEVSNIQREVGVAHMVNTHDMTKQCEQDETIKTLMDTQLVHQQEIRELTLKLDTSEKQRQNANVKVKALRDRLKNMQDSWQKISTDTESSFSALRDQYQQQIKEYKSIIDSLKSQNTSLNTRMESLKKVTSQSNNGKVGNLEQQISEYKQITDGYREENILLRKELRGVVQGLQNGEDSSKSSCKRNPKPDEFSRLKDIIHTAKSECENLQLHKGSRSRTSTADRDVSYSDSRTINKYNSASVDVEDLYERTTEDTANSTSTKQPRAPDIKEKSWSKYSSLQSSAGRMLEPLAISTPRANKMNSYSTPVKCHDEMPIPTASTRTYSSQKKLPTTNHDNSDSIRSNRFKYDSPGNLRHASFKDNKSSTTVTSSQLSSNTAKPYSSLTAITQAPSKTKEVIELKKRNSAELDPSKSFKPINPDNDNLASETATKYQPVAPSYKLSASYLTSNSGKPYVAGSSGSNYTRPYRSSYEPSTYKSKYSYSDSKTSKPSDDYRNVSADSAYGSPSRSYSKLPSISSYNSPYRNDHSMPGTTSTTSRYSAPSGYKSGGDNSFSKRLDYEIEQTDLLNRTLEDIELSIDSISSVSREDKYLMSKIKSSNYEPRCTKYRTSQRGLYPSTSALSSIYHYTAPSHYTAPREVTFHGSIIYDSIYL